MTMVNESINKELELQDYDDLLLGLFLEETSVLSLFKELIGYGIILNEIYARFNKHNPKTPFITLGIDELYPYLVIVQI
jgi:hypothetical protein